LFKLDNNTVENLVEQKIQYQVLFIKFSSFMDEIDRITEPSFKPSQQDMLRLKVATTGINEIRFTKGVSEFR